MTLPLPWPDPIMPLRPVPWKSPMQWCSNFMKPPNTYKSLCSSAMRACPSEDNKPLQTSFSMNNFTVSTSGKSFSTLPVSSWVVSLPTASSTREAIMQSVPPLTVPSRHPVQYAVPSSQMSLCALTPIHKRPWSPNVGPNSHTASACSRSSALIPTKAHDPAVRVHNPVQSLLAGSGSMETPTPPYGRPPVPSPMHRIRMPTFVSCQTYVW
jgi:hypothetical protein